jgi:hypothetical protein
MIFVGCVGGKDTEVDNEYLRRTPHAEVSSAKVEEIQFPNEQMYLTGEKIEFKIFFLKTSL